MNAQDREQYELVSRGVDEFGDDASKYFYCTPKTAVKLWVEKEIRTVDGVLVKLSSGKPIKVYDLEKDNV